MGPHEEMVDAYVHMKETRLDHRISGASALQEILPLFECGSGMRDREYHLYYSKCIQSSTLH